MRLMWIATLFLGACASQSGGDHPASTQNITPVPPSGESVTTVEAVVTAPNWLDGPPVYAPSILIGIYKSSGGLEDLAVGVEKTIERNGARVSSISVTCGRSRVGYPVAGIVDVDLGASTGSCTTNEVGEYIALNLAVRRSAREAFRLEYLTYSSERKVWTIFIRNGRSEDGGQFEEIEPVAPKALAPVPTLTSP